MLIAKNISKSIGSKTLFEKVSFSAAPGERIALVGENGSGKSTFLRILAGLETADAGKFEAVGERIAFVPQELEAAPGETIGGFCGGKEHAVLASLKAVGMESFGLSHQVAELSGGQKTRVMIAKALLSHPTILLLDEPTNHLDREGVDWFRNLIRSFRGIVFCVSHDREFLEDMTRIFEIYPDDRSFDSYVGGWHEYKRLRAEKRQQRQNDYDEQQEEKRRLEEYLKWRQAQASRSSNPNLGAQVRMLKKRLEREIYSQELARPKDAKTISGTSISGEVHDGKLLLDFKEVTFASGEKIILYKISFQIRGKERVILSGKNGSGKSTILKIAMGILYPANGEAKLGANVRVGYFAQQHETLDPEETVQEAFENTERLRKIGKDSRSILAGFLFTDNALKKRVGDLSPGERVRLIFAKMIHQENELLLLDEPTNHLDIQSKEVIEKALAGFEGGIFAVSHDPYFIEAIGTDRELRIENGNLQSRLL